MRVAVKIFLAVLLVHATLALASSAEIKTTRIDDAIGKWAWGGVGEPLVIGQQSMILFGRNDKGTGAIAWRLNWADDTATTIPLPGLTLDKYLRYSAVQSSVGLWLVGPSIALLRPNGRMLSVALHTTAGPILQTEMRFDRPPIVALTDGSILVFTDQELKGPRHILSVRLASDGNSLQVTPRALLSYDGTPNGKNYREPEYGHSVVLLKDGRVLMFGDERTPKLASIFDPAAASMTPVAPMPHARSLAASALLSDGRVAVAGARNLRCYDAEAREVDLYDVQANTWTTLPSLLLPLCADAYGAWRPSITEASDGSLVLGGGLEPELMVLARDKHSTTGFASAWRRVGSLPVPRIGGVVQALPGNRVVVAGGVHNPEGFGGCCQRTTGVDRISLDGSPPAFGPGALSLNEPGVALRGERLFVAGGRRFSMTSSGQMRYGSEAEVIDLKTGESTQLDAVPVVAGAMDAVWLDDDRVLVKGRLAASDRVFQENTASYMPEGSAAMAIYSFSKRGWTLVEIPKAIYRYSNGSWRVEVPDLRDSRLLGMYDDKAVFLAASGGLQTWRVGEAQPAAEPDTVGGSVGKEGAILMQPDGRAARILPDGRVVLASNRAPSDIVSLFDDACDDVSPTCKERFVGFGPMSLIDWYEVVKLGEPEFHLATRHFRLAEDSLSVSHAIDMEGRVIRLNWTAKPDESSEPRVASAAPGWSIERTLSVSNHTWEPLPVPLAWRSENIPGANDCDWASYGYVSRCQLLALADPRDPTGQSTLLFLRSTRSNRDSRWYDPKTGMTTENDTSDTSIGMTTVWWFNELARRWELALQIDGLQARYAMFELPKTLFPGTGKLRSIGWHLDQPILWVD